MIYLAGSGGATSVKVALEKTSSYQERYSRERRLFAEIERKIARRPTTPFTQRLKDILSRGKINAKGFVERGKVISTRLHQRARVLVDKAQVEAERVKGALIPSPRPQPIVVRTKPEVPAERIDAKPLPWLLFIIVGIVAVLLITRK